MIVSVEYTTPTGTDVRATANVVEVENERGRGLVCEGYPTLVCATWGHRIEVPAWVESDIESELVVEAGRQIARLSP